MKTMVSGHRFDLEVKSQIRKRFKKSVLQFLIHTSLYTRPRSAVGNVSDCGSRGREFAPGLFHHFRGD